MTEIFRLARNALIAFAAVAGTLLAAYLVITRPEIVHVRTFTPDSRTTNGITSVRGGALFSIGASDIILSSGELFFFSTLPGYEPVEVNVGSTVDVVRGDVKEALDLGFYHLLRVRLTTDSPLVMREYSGTLTASEENLPQVLSLHPRVKGSRRLDAARRQFVLKTRRPAEEFPYLGIDVVPDGAGGISEVQLDFSHAGGGAIEYLPPLGWSHGNLLRRIEYSMREAPAIGYRPQLRLEQRQFKTPYDMGYTFFYCTLGERFCAGKISLLYDRGKQRHRAIVTLWVNSDPLDRRIRLR